MSGNRAVSPRSWRLRKSDMNAPSGRKPTSSAKNVNRQRLRNCATASGVWPDRSSDWASLAS
jgi:hypothetical protein